MEYLFLARHLTNLPEFDSAPIPVLRNPPVDLPVLFYMYNYISKEEERKSISKTIAHLDHQYNYVRNRMQEQTATADRAVVGYGRETAYCTYREE